MSGHPGPDRGAIARNPDARRRVGTAYAELLAVILASVLGIGGLLLWHLSRRGRLIRDRLGNPRPVRWPEQDDDRDRTEGPQ
ncbi:hypothetical protein [Tautonia sociabilis]|uniref:Uncharacterized protein n=1 Tax=Tautonia sociabilis TaxID=2080755 RepID=A0A432MIW6_9BACT|nr:hypothetical protein [Tautonia sociabilis]RUL87138.1 hypothetical protein TsocGM_13735 [Tautonia sociabilis]